MERKTQRENHSKEAAIHMSEIVKQRCATK